MKREIKRGLTCRDYICRTACASASIFLSLSLLLASARASDCLDKAAQSEKSVCRLEPGKPAEREMKGGDSHSFHLSLASGQFLYLIVDQRGVDVMATLAAPDGRKLVEMDSPTGGFGQERILWIAETSGAYSLEIHPIEWKADPGRYEARIEALRAPTEEDLLRLKAENIFMEAEHLLEQGSAESMRKAFENYKESLPLFQQLRDRGRAVNALLCLGVVRGSFGEMQKALDYYDQVLPLYREMNDFRGEVVTLVKIANVYAYLGEHQKALDYYERAMQVRDQSGYHDNALPTINSIGEMYAAMGNSEKALEYFNRALKGWNEAELPEWSAFALENIGAVYYSEGKFEKALDHYNRALPLFHQYSRLRIESRTLNRIGLVYAAMGNLESALDFLNQSLSLSRAAGDRGGEASALYNLARIERERGNINAARELIEKALGITEFLRANVTSPEVRASFLASVRDYYDLQIDLLMRAGGQDAAALETSERARARSLLDVLGEVRAGIRQGVEISLLERERFLQQKLNDRAERQMRLSNRKRTEEEAAAIEKEIRAITTEYQEVQAQIRARSPHYASLTQPQPLSLGEIQEQVLDQDTLLLEYALGDERSYLWAVAKNSITSFALPKRAEVEAASRRVYELLTAPNKHAEGETERQKAARLSRAEADYSEAATALSRMVLGPAASKLTAKRLIVVADGALQYVPLAALPAPAASDSGSRPLIADHEIVSLPSASALAVLRRELSGREPAAKAVAVLADPVFSRDDPRLKSAKKSRATDAGMQSVKRDLERAMNGAGMSDGKALIARLPFSRREAEAIIAAAPAGQADEAVDFDANRERATNPGLARYRVVHFATHGLLNSEHPELSGIVLSLVDAKGQPRNGFLRLHEIYNLNLPAELVVLSACQTALGKEIRGEGLVGLTRGFMYAGARRVMASLWKVDDLATAELMKRFYDGMFLKSLPPAAALRAAQVEMRKQKRWQSPYYWAAFVIQGEWK